MISTVKIFLPYYKRNLKLALPVIIAQIGQVMVQQVDNMMVGHRGTLDLAASAFANSIFIIGMIITMGFSFGMTPIVGKSVARGDKTALSSIFYNSLFINIALNIAIGILLLLAIFAFPFMNQKAGVAELAIPYYIVLVISLIPLSFFFTFKQFSEGIGNTKNAMYITIVGNLVNVIFNYFLIYGKFGFPEMGLLGAGIATLLSRIVMALGFAYIFARKEAFIPYFLVEKIPLINKVYLKELFHLGYPISLQLLLEVLAFAIGAIMAGWLGVVAIASHQIVLGLASISFMIVVGIGSATTIRVSHQLGTGDIHAMTMAAKASVHLVISFMAMTGALFYLFRYYIPQIYSNDVAVIELCSQLLIFAAMFQLFDGLQVVMLSILRGIGDVKRAMVYAFIAYIVVNIPLAYLLTFELGLGIIGIWIAFIVGLGFASTLFYIRYRNVLKNISNHLPK